MVGEGVRRLFFFRNSIRYSLVFLLVDAARRRALPVHNIVVCSQPLVVFAGGARSAGERVTRAGRTYRKPRRSGVWPHCASAGFALVQIMRWHLVLLLLAVSGGGLATLGPPRLPPWRDRRPPPLPRLFDWGAEDAEAERVGEETIGGMLGGWERLVAGVEATVGGVVDRVRQGVDRVREGVGGVAEGVQRAVSGAAHDAGEVIGSVALAANPAIFPGTNWCGVGDRASRYNETGVFKLADACCRDHDSCPESIGAGESKHGVKNEGLYTMSLCKCDREFYRCLKDSDSIVAQNIGFMFFNVLRLKCFTYDYPLTCKKESSAHHCEEYSAKSSTAKKVWQLLDNPSY